MLIKLEPHEIRYAKYVAKLRTAENKKNAAFDRNEQIGKMDRQLVDEIGCLGELSACKFLNKYWYAAVFSDQEYKDKKIRPNDVTGYEIKTTIHKTGRLLVRPETPDDSKVLLVCQHSETEYFIAGWQFAKECKQPEHWQYKGMKNCWAYPQNLLRQDY